MNDYSLEDFHKVLCLRNQLIYLSLPSLLKIYENYENYLFFLDCICHLISMDGAFLLFSPILIEKIESLLQIHRFDIESCEIKEGINEIIRYLNKLKSCDDFSKDLLKETYVTYQEETRGIHFRGEEQFFNCLGYDAVVYMALTEDKMDIIEEDSMFLSSINHFTRVIPELFSDEEIKERAMQKITEIENTKWPYPRKIRNYSKETKNNFQKIKQKEE